MLTPAQLEDVSKMPTLEELRESLVATISPTPLLQTLTGMLQRPAADLRRTLEASQTNLVSSLERHATKDGDDTDSSK